MTEDELEEFVRSTQRSAHVRLLAACSERHPFPTYRNLSEVVDARGAHHCNGCYLWNASISPEPEVRVSRASENVFGRDLYFLDTWVSQVAELGGSVGRLYTVDLRPQAFAKWYASLVGWFRRRCKYFPGECEWASEAYVQTLPCGADQLRGNRHLNLQITVDDIRDLLAFARRNYIVHLVRGEMAEPSLELYEDPDDPDDFLKVIDEIWPMYEAGHMGAAELCIHRLWNESLFSPPDIQKVEHLAIGKITYQIGLTNLVVITTRGMHLACACRCIPPEGAEEARNLFAWYESLIGWIKANCDERTIGRRTEWVSRRLR